MRREAIALIQQIQQLSSGQKINCTIVNLSNFEYEINYFFIPFQVSEKALNVVSFLMIFPAKDFS